MFVLMKLVKGYMSWMKMLRWSVMGGTYLAVIGFLGAALVNLLGGVVDFNSADGFEMILETWLTLVLVNVNGLGGAGGGGGGREPIDACFCIPDTLCMTQHVAHYNWYTLVF